MTISNSNLSSALGINLGLPAEGMMAVQMPSMDNLSAASGDTLNEGDFWSMLSQQLMGIVEQDDLQVIENEDLLALFSDFEQVLEGSDEGQQVAAQWMQILKSHFSSEDSAQSAGLNQADGDEQVLTAALLLNDPLANADGEGLPPGRQTLSAALALDINTQARQGQQPLPGAITSNLAADAEMTDQQDLDASLLKGEGASKQSTERSLEEMAALLSQDKSMRQQSSSDSSNALLKDHGFSIQGMQTQSVSMNGQNSIHQNLSPTLQTLSLSPQSPASEWGHALGERVSFLINQKLNSAEIRIDPPHLGKLDIQIQVKDDAAMIVIHTQHAQTRDLIDSASIRLREFLQDAGYSSVDVNVSHREQSMAEQGFNQPANQRDNEVNHSGHATGPDSVENTTVRAQLVVDDGRIDYFA